MNYFSHMTVGLGLGHDDSPSAAARRASGPDAVSGRTLAPYAGVTLTVTVVAACYCPGPHKSRFRCVRAQYDPDRLGLVYKLYTCTAVLV